MLFLQKYLLTSSKHKMKALGTLFIWNFIYLKKNEILILILPFGNICSSTNGGSGKVY
jgi:hypothetical protein